MNCKLIDGNKIAQEVRHEAAERANLVLKKTGIRPGLATVLVGTDPASQTYVRMKHKACEEAGIESFGLVLPAGVSQSELEAKVAQLAADERVHGILVQLPLPKHLDTEAVLSKVPLGKDVDGFHPMNIGLLARRGCEPHFVPCTPWGCIALLERSGVPIDGRRAVVLGRSNIVGLPMALLLQERNATVTVVHSRTQNPEALMKEADILVAAIGIPEMVKGSMLKEGVAVIDVGINKIDAEDDPRGYRLVGDVDFESAREKAGWLTPVPGGVGPMTIAMLLENTVLAAERVLLETEAAV
ncbi:MAG: bifunctional methylenetetrahydrofolate dehydrogenase/methenyltetrahydrofolate cyclohydrolase FolD [Vulcanimicrobiota bacterium]